MPFGQKLWQLDKVVQLRGYQKTMLKLAISCAAIVCLFLSIAVIGANAGGLNPLDIGRAIRLIPEDEKDRPDRTPFVIVGRADYVDVSWLIAQRTGDRIGYAPWNTYDKRWNLFSLNAKYSGFVQATLGQRAPLEHYQQFLRYDRDGKYQGMYVATLGGRPRTPDLPQGELGGQLVDYEIGNIPLGPMGLDVIINYAKPPGGMNISIVPRLR
jgi:hypothetical protein